MATSEQKQDFFKITEQIKKQGKKMLIVNKVRPDDEMMDHIVDFLLKKQMRVNQLLAQTDES